MKPAHCLALATAAGFYLNACASNSSFVTSSQSNTAAVSPTQSQLDEKHTSRAGPALYVFNTGNGKSFNVSVYSGGGATHLRNVPIGPYSTAFAVGGSRLYFGYPTDPAAPDGAGSLNIYSSRGAELVRTLKQTKPFAFLTLDESGNLYTQCSGDKVCEYANAKQHIIRKIAFNKFGFTFYSLATDPSGDLAAGSPSGVLVFAPGQTSPYWTITAGVGPMAFDSSGNLYAGAGNGSSSSIEVYAPKGQSPIRSITKGVTNPLFLALDQSDDLYVLNRGVVQGGRCVQPTEVTVYSPGSSSPSRTISSGLQCDGSRMLAVDSSGELYVPNYLTASNPSGNVVVYATGSSAPLRTVTKGIVNPSAVGIGR